MGCFMTTIPEIFDKLGGIQNVASLIGCKYSSASEMKRRQIIPVWHWPKLIDGCKEKKVKGVNPTILMFLHIKDRK